MKIRLFMQEGEEVLYKGYPERAILILWFFGALAIALFITFILNTIITGITETFDTYALSYFIIFIPVLILAFLYQVALRRSYHYYVTNERVIIEGGILLKKIKSVPYHKITDVSIYQNIFERIIGISTLNIHTAGTGMQIPEIRFFGLNEPEKPQSIIVNELKAFKSDKKNFSTLSD